VFLTFNSGRRSGQVVEVPEEGLVIGRDRACDVRLRDADASRRHTSLKPLADGRAVVEDLGSLNGTLVDGERISGPTVLDGGEEIRIGKTLMAASLRADAPTRGRRLWPVAAAAVLVVAAVVAVVLVTREREEPAPGELARALAHSTVRVLAERDGRRAGGGTGWVLDAQRGSVVTNAHAVRGGERFRLEVSGERRPARLAGVSPCADLAVLSADDRRGLTTPELGSQSDLERGERVVALGFPSGSRELIATTGRVTAPRTTFDASQNPDLQRYPNAIGFDAALAAGYSGGPLVTSEEKVVGTNTVVFQGGSGAAARGYAIPTVRRELDRLARGRSVGWAGFGFRVPAGGDLSRNDLPPGLLVTGVVPGTPAARAGLGRGPALITAIAGRRVSSYRDYCSAVAALSPGEPAAVSYLGRGGRKRIRMAFG